MSSKTQLAKKGKQKNRSLSSKIIWYVVIVLLCLLLLALFLLVLLMQNISLKDK
jgi:uncharacterized integral membrane protein